MSFEDHEDLPYIIADINKEEPDPETLHLGPEEVVLDPEVFDVAHEIMDYFQELVKIVNGPVDYKDVIHVYEKIDVLIPFVQGVGKMSREQVDEFYNNTFKKLGKPEDKIVVE